MTDPLTAGLAPLIGAVDSWPAAVVVVVVFLGGHAVTFVQGRRTKKLAAAAAAAAAETREQTVNDHADHPTPNLRVQLDAIHEDVRAARAIAAEAKQAVEATSERLDAHITHAQESDARRDEWQLAVERDLTRLNRPLFAWRR